MIDRLLPRLDANGTPLYWFFKSSEGLQGPYESAELARAKLAEFIAQCRSEIDGHSSPS